jgi:hypothetical protein
MCFAAEEAGCFSDGLVGEHIIELARADANSV